MNSITSINRKAYRSQLTPLTYFPLGEERKGTQRDVSISSSCYPGRWVERRLFGMSRCFLAFFASIAVESGNSE